MNCKVRSLFLVLLLVAPLSFAESAGTGLQISAAGDIVGRFSGTGNNRLDPREAEVLLYAPIDQLFDGTLNLASHYENGELHFELHELVFGSTKLIPRSRFRIGKYFLNIGRLNQFHRHDWPFTSAPKVQEEFFDDEGVNDTGIEYSYLFPTALYLDLTVGITNGWTYGHSHNAGSSPILPLYYIRLVTYNDLFGGGMQTGLNFLSRKDGSGTSMSLLGLDLTAKWREANYLKLLLQNEFWVRRTVTSVMTEDMFGFYLYPQYALDQNWSIGTRIDGYMNLSQRDLSNVWVPNFDYGVMLGVNYKASEFSTIRASYNVKGHLEGGVESSAERYLELQWIFILGSHPAHDF